MATSSSVCSLSPIPAHSDAAAQAQSRNQKEASPECQERADAGHNSGMGMIFREVAGITAVETSAVRISAASNVATASAGPASQGTDVSQDNIDQLSRAAAVSAASLLLLALLCARAII